MLKFGPYHRAYFSLRSDSLRVKIRDITKIPKILIKISLFLKEKKAVFKLTSPNNCIDWAGTGVIRLNCLEEQGLGYFS